MSIQTLIFKKVYIISIRKETHFIYIYFSVITALPFNLWIATALLSHKEFAHEIATFSLMYKALNWITIITAYDMLSADMAAAFVGSRSFKLNTIRMQRGQSKPVHQNANLTGACQIHSTLCSCVTCFLTEAFALQLCHTELNSTHFHSNIRCHISAQDYSLQRSWLP